MPLVISEIRVQMRVDEGGGEPAAPPSDPADADLARELLIAECVRRVLRALNTLEER